MLTQWSWDGLDKHCKGIQSFYRNLADTFHETALQELDGLAEWHRPEVQHSHHRMQRYHQSSGNACAQSTWNSPYIIFSYAGPSAFFGGFACGKSSAAAGRWSRQSTWNILSISLFVHSNLQDVKDGFCKGCGAVSCRDPASLLSCLVSCSSLAGCSCL